MIYKVAALALTIPTTLAMGISLDPGYEARVAHLQALNSGDLEEQCAKCVAAEKTLEDMHERFDALIKDEVRLGGLTKRAVLELSEAEVAEVSAHATVKEIVGSGRSGQKSVCQAGAQNDAWGTAIDDTKNKKANKETAEENELRATNLVFQQQKAVMEQRLRTHEACEGVKGYVFDKNADENKFTEREFSDEVKNYNPAFFTEDFTSTSMTRHEHTSEVVESKECRSGGRCAKFTGCNSAGDLFTISKVACPAGKKCTLSYWYKGVVLAGGSTKDRKGHSHWWYPHVGAAIPQCDDWCEMKRDYTGKASYLMFETWANRACSSSLLDDITVSVD